MVIGEHRVTVDHVCGDRVRHGEQTAGEQRHDDDQSAELHVQPSPTGRRGGIPNPLRPNRHGPPRRTLRGACARAIVGRRQGSLKGSSPWAAPRSATRAYPAIWRGDRQGGGPSRRRAITQNEKLWTEFDSVTDRSVVVEWSLGDNYRTEAMESGDRAIFWITGRSGGIARVGFVLTVQATPKGRWKDAHGKIHAAPFSGQFFLPPFPNRRYISRSALAGDPRMANCELTTAAQRQSPLRIEATEWKVIERLLLRFDRSNFDFRAAWP